MPRDRQVLSPVKEHATVKQVRPSGRSVARHGVNLCPCVVESDSTLNKEHGQTTAIFGRGRIDHKVLTKVATRTCLRVPLLMKGNKPCCLPAPFYRDFWKLNVLNCQQTLMSPEQKVPYPMPDEPTPLSPTADEVFKAAFFSSRFKLVYKFLRSNLTT